MSGPRYMPSPSEMAVLVNIHTTNPLSDSHWDDLVARHPRASAFHQWGWLEALSRTSGEGPERALRAIVTNVNGRLVYKIGQATGAF
jgi:hypothetical protein